MVCKGMKTKLPTDMFTCSGIPRFWVPYLESRYENCMVLEHRVCYKLKMLKELLFGTPLLVVFV